jgi:alpha-beta hydrolase superfamily lysophospholipase
LWLALTIAALGAACAPTLRPAGPALAEPRFGPDSFIAADGAALPLRRWLPDGEVRAVILALHGFNDYSNAFDAPAKYWAGHGIATYAYDQRGFGAAPHRGFWPGAATMTADLAAAARLVRRRHPGTPLYLAGDSMGGAVIMVALADAALADAGLAADGAVLVAPAVWGRRHMNPFQRGLLWLLSHTMPWLTLTGQGLKIKPSDNEAMLRALSRDPKVIKRTRVDAIKGLVDLMDAAYASAPALKGPLLMLYGRRDEIIPEGPSFEVLAVLRAKAGARVALYDDGYHMLLRDLAAEAPWRDIVAWIADADRPLPSGADDVPAGTGLKR